MGEFDRNVWCLLGIPVDVVSIDQALDAIYDSAASRSPCMFSTPNLNFIVSALGDESFRNSVIQSDLVLLDGMPPVWIARLLGVQGIQKVSGSNLFEQLMTHRKESNEKLKLFLFGGEEGVAEKACQNINASSPAIECVGTYDPGFGSVEEMSTEAIRTIINQSQADFLLVALGAKKGQSWIMANKSRLDTPVISHLGAVINFAAGNVRRAPGWMQAVGVEWLWRILQEPRLWKRYLTDGACFSRLLVLNVLPYVLWRKIHADRLNSKVPVSYSISEDEQATTICLQGDCVCGTIAPLRPLFQQHSENFQRIILDLSGAGLIDGAFLGTCMLLYKQALNNDFPLVFTGVSPSNRRVFRLNCLEYLL